MRRRLTIGMCAAVVAVSGVLEAQPVEPLGTARVVVDQPIPIFGDPKGRKLDTLPRDDPRLKGPLTVLGVASNKRVRLELGDKSRVWIEGRHVEIT
jgi:hypothetical protein